MSSVWYVGRAKTRSISVAEWAAAGVTAAADTIWNSANGYSIPSASLAAPQIALLATTNEFNTTAPDGPRTAPVVEDDSTTATKGFVTSRIASAISAQSIVDTATFAPAGDGTRPLRAVALGTSIYAGGLRATDGVVVLKGQVWGTNDSVGQQQAGPESWFTYLCLLSGGRILNVFNAGISSGLLSEMVTRFQSDVVAKRPDVVFLGDATNEINNAVDDTTIRGYVDTMVKAARSAGIAPILVATIHPTDSTKAARSIVHNAWMRAYAAKNRIPYIDPFSVLVDAASTTGGPLAGLTSDGLHPNAAGAKLAGQKALDDLAGLLRGNATPSRTPYLPQHRVNGTAANLLPNPLFQDDVNADGKADSWAFSGAGATYTIVTDSAVVGKAQQMVVASSTAQIMRDLTVDGTTISVGDRLAWSGMVKVDAAAGALNWFLQIGKLGGTGTHAVRPMGQVVGLDMPWFPFYCEYVVQANTPSIRLSAQTAAGTGTITVGQMKLANLTKLGIDAL